MSLNKTSVARPWHPGPVVELALVLIRTPRTERSNVQFTTEMFVIHAIGLFPSQLGLIEAPRPEPNRIRSCSTGRLSPDLGISGRPPQPKRGRGACGGAGLGAGLGAVGN